MGTFFAGLGPQVVLVVGAFVGMIAHIMKKRIEEGLDPGETELSVFRKYILAKPMSTLIAGVAAIGVAEGLASTAVGASNSHILLTAITAGFASNSLANRPGE